MRPRFLYKEFLLKHQQYVDMFWTWAGSSVCLLCIALLDYFIFESQNIEFLLASFGASVVLVFGAPASPLAQPRNTIGGSFISALAGVTCQLLFGSIPMLAICTSVSSAIFLMTITKTLHPPGGATALLAVVGDEQVKSLGYTYALTPCLFGASVIVLLGYLFARFTGKKTYPQTWF